MGTDLLGHYDLGDRIIRHNELQKALGKAKTNEANRVHRIPNEIMKNNLSPQSHLVQAPMLLISSILYLYHYRCLYTLDSHCSGNI